MVYGLCHGSITENAKLNKLIAWAKNENFIVWYSVRSFSTQLLKSKKCCSI